MEIKHKFTRLTMNDGEVFIAKENVDSIATKMNGLNVGKSIMQPVTTEDDVFDTFPTRLVNLYHVKYVDGEVFTEIVDVEPPEISYTGDNPVHVEFGTTFNVPEVEVVDNRDESPEVLTEIRTESGSTLPEIDTRNPGNYVIKYTATDEAGNSDVFELNVVVEDYVDTTPPDITYSGDNPIILEHGAPFSVPSVSVSDSDDPNPSLSSAITDSGGSVVSTIDTTVAGDYTITYTAVDNAGNSSTYTVNVTVEEYVDDVAPDLLYAGADPIEVEYEGTFEFPQVSATDNVDPNPEITHVITGPDGGEVSAVDTTVSGDYGITFTATDSSGNTSSLSISVIVGDPPEPEVRVETETETAVVPYETVERDNAEMLVGTSETVQEGVNGERTITYEVTYTDDVETGREKVSDEITTEPVDEIIENGTMPEEPGEPEPDPEPEPEEEE